MFHLHVGVLAFPFGTHAAPLLALVQRLSVSAPDTLFSFFNSASSNKKVFDERALVTYPNIRARDVWDGTPRGEVFTGSHFEAVGLFLKASPGNFEKVIEEAEVESGVKISCLITDAFLWFGCDLGEKKGVPWLAFWTSASCSLSAHMYTDQLLKEIQSTGSEEQVKIQSPIPGLEMTELDDLPPEIFYDKNPSPLALTLNNMVQNLPISTAVILNSFEEIDPIITKDLKSKFHHFLNVGPSILTSPTPPPLDDKTGCLPWLESQTRPNSVVYISFGTVATPPEDELAALCEALETCGFPFLWSLNDQGMKTLPEGFLDRTARFGKIVPWAPQPRVLAHESVGVFMSHCGWNSMLESICSGVPIICRPFFGDQKLNSRMVQDCWKIGVRVGGGVFSRSGAIEALNCVMKSGEGDEMRENVCQLKRKATVAVESQGSSFKNFEKLLEIIKN